MLHEPDVLEARQIADLAADARRVRDRLLEKVPTGSWANLCRRGANTTLAVLSR